MGASTTFGWTVPEGLPFVLGPVSRDGWDGWDAEAVSSDKLRPNRLEVRNRNAPHSA